MHLASSAGHSDVVAALILVGCDVNVSDSVSTFLVIRLVIREQLPIKLNCFKGFDLPNVTVRTQSKAIEFKFLVPSPGECEEFVKKLFSHG